MAGDVAVGSARHNCPHQDHRDLRFSPNEAGYSRDDNSLVKSLANLPIHSPRRPKLHGRKLGQGWVAAHVGHMSTGNPLLNSFVGNLLWLPEPLASLTDHLPKVQALVQTNGVDPLPGSFRSLSTSRTESNRPGPICPNQTTKG